MKKRVALVLAVLLALLIIPIPSGVYKDGGTREYTALTYKIVKWNRLSEGGTFKKTAVYPVPLNFLSIDRLYNRETKNEKAEKEELSFSAQYIRTNGYTGEEYPKTFVIASKKELDDYYIANKEKYDLSRNDKTYSDTTIGFLNACDRYDAEYFEEKNLVLLLLEEGSGSIRHRVESFIKNENGYEINVARLVPEAGTDDMAEWHIIIETDKSVTTAENITVLLDGVDPLTVPKFVHESRGAANISLYVPRKGWVCETGEKTDNTELAITLRPAGEEGVISIEFKSVFGVCGTGLENEEITLGQYKANKGTYDGKAVWDYIALEDTPGNYVIMNKGIDSWWSEYGDAAMEILSTLKVGEGIISETRAIELAKQEAKREYETIAAWFDYEKGLWFVNFCENETREGELITLSGEGKLFASEKRNKEGVYEKTTDGICGYPTADKFN